LHLSDEQQLKRFKDRESDPLKQWNSRPKTGATEKAWAYLDALKDMVEMTDKPHAHWDLIPSDSKHYSRVAVLETLIERWVHDLERRGLKAPKPRSGDYLS